MKIIIAILLTLFSFVTYAEKIEYEIYEIQSGKLIGSGIKIYTVDDIIVKPYTGNGREVVEKHIELEQGFKIGARIFPGEQLTGFGLLAEKTSKDFSWEWYNQIEGSTFKKLQGAQGLVTIRVSKPLKIELLEEVIFFR